MAEKKEKTLKGSDIVLTGTDKSGKKINITAQIFKLVDFKDCKLSGDPYYLEKAVSLGALKA